jgi:nickel-dependent lactate racemase
LSDNYNVEIIEPHWVDSVNDQNNSITEALKNPLRSKPLSENIKSNYKVAIIFSDITRATPYQVILTGFIEPHFFVGFSRCFMIRAPRTISGEIPGRPKSTVIMDI